MLGIAGLLAACGDALTPTDPLGFSAQMSAPSNAQIETNMVRQGTTDSLTMLSATFWAVRGEDREAIITYTDPNVAPAKFLRLRIRKKGLAAYPDGTPFAEGDSVLVSVTVDPERFLVQLEPSGLQFDPDDLPQMKIWYGKADHDFNGDGVIDAADENIRVGQLSVFFQPTDGASWNPQGAEHDTVRELFEVRLQHFSNYAVSW